MITMTISMMDNMMTVLTTMTMMIRLTIVANSGYLTIHEFDEPDDSELHHDLHGFNLMAVGNVVFIMALSTLMCHPVVLG